MYNFILLLLITRMPGYVEKADELKAKGVELIACIVSTVQL